MKSFQSLFPPLSPNTLSLTSARRVVLVSYNADRSTIDFRHYIIKVKPYGVSKRVRRILEGTTHTKSTLDLGNEKDVADFLLRKTGEPGPDGGYESAASSTESVAGDDGDAVDLAEDYVGRNNKKGQRRAVRLDEVGPRMELRLIKITEGVPGKEGAVMYHEFGMIIFPSYNGPLSDNKVTVKKSKKEASAQKAEHAARTKLKKERREEQERNVQRKLEKEKVEEGEESGEEGHDDGWDGIGKWDDDEEISDGEDSDAPVESGSDEESSEEERPTKRVKLREKR
jgi:ribosome biogenesis protein SSF1/2